MSRTKCTCTFGVSKVCPRHGRKKRSGRTSTAGTYTLDDGEIRSASATTPEAAEVMERIIAHNRNAAYSLAATRMRDLCVAKMEDYRRRIQYESDEGVREALFGDMVIEVQSLSPVGGNKMTDSITLHQASDRTYHWCCPNCAKENIGVDHETDLTTYLPNVRCQNCGFQFAVTELFSEIEMAKSGQSLTLDQVQQEKQ